MMFASHTVPFIRTLLPDCPTVLVVENALEDARFASNPLVLGFPHIRFYAGEIVETCVF